MSTTPRSAAQSEGRPLPAGTEDRLQGWGVMGVPLDGGHYLALRHWTASSFGPPYTGVWHRDPRGRWTVWADHPPEVSCARFVGSAAHRVVTAPVGLTWEDECRLVVEVEDLRWRMTLAPSPATTALSSAGSVLPEAAWGSAAVLRLMGLVGGSLLRTGPLRLAGTMPCGQGYRIGSRLAWLLERTRADRGGRLLGHEQRHDRPVTIGPVLLPARGVFFADATGRFTAPAPHTGERDHPGRRRTGTDVR